MALGNGNGNGGGTKIEAVTESVSMRLIARVSMVATPFLIVGVGWIFVEVWSEQRKLNEKITERLEGLSNRVLTIEIERSMEDRAERASRRSSSRPLTVPREALPPPE